MDHKELIDHALTMEYRVIVLEEIVELLINKEKVTQDKVKLLELEAREKIREFYPELDVKSVRWC